MTAPAAPSLPPWHDEGRRVAGAVDRASAVLVVGRDPEVAAWVALGIAREQAAHRRVAVGDLVGDVAPIQSLVAGDDPHGIVDSFRYGVSLNAIARPVVGADNLFVLPSGSEGVDDPEILASDRWRRLAGGFREVGALLLLVAHADAPGLDALAGMVDGIVIAGDAAGALPDAPAPLAVVAAAGRRPRAAATPPEPVASAARPVPGGAPDDAFAAAAAAAFAAPAAATQPADDPVGSRRAPRAAGASAAAPVAAPEPDGVGGDWRRWAIAAGAAVTLAVGAFFYLLPSRANDGGAVPARADSASARPIAAGPTPRPDSAPRRDSAAAAVPPALRPGDPLPALTLANPGDSLAAASYAVWIGSGNTADVSTLAAGADVGALPVPAVTPLLEDGQPWYRLLVGAFRTSAEAERLLGELRRQRILGASSGSIVRAPYALLVADRVPASEVVARMQPLLARGVPVYPLSRGDGTVGLYAGAFELRDQAAYLARTLQAAGVRPVLVYRTGRSL